ncbi:polysaccharide pyruvyl transferase family protein [Clostridium perfringens]|uniref:polysaccharide pyruvyl transferase family protein n=1 Tax=Clostridium perfringens TaxID=1502 RepID=UPI000F52D2AF|nr:polysaccharide pyruvyl transferase family protein [Clostridium perfringens]MDK3121720.1 polysaccharide pyruvyl transferase family protein [Clostridium perfringens]MDM0851337.1 polysaccharide pyruvyl transferase family protein [Clostridium perfringens]MDM0854259.1 polysaccharide pyruvyl transferase family protein [Clostridium perfringens]RQN11023.1 polysaccharide pyruvyl transferase family protein [Clostridium perfringens]
MKVGIINFHCAHNYGAMLQAYALQENLKKEGHNAIIIDFQPDSIVEGYKLWSVKKIMNPKIVAWTIKNYRKLKPKYDVFEKFKKEKFNLTDKKYKSIDKEDIEKESFDAFVCGSDQIWNMDLNGGLTEYLLSFASEKNKKISYAASIGVKSIKNEYIDIMKKELYTFDSISVREDEAVNIMKETFNLEATHVLDPVFLLSKKEWKDIAIKLKKKKEKYVLLYGLEENELFEKTFKFIKDNTDMKIINISPAKKVSEYIDETIYSVGPREFIGLLEEAELVFTNSFHGTCFSIIFGKKFFTIGHSELNSRLESILRLTNLESHMINKEFQSLDEFYNTIDIESEKVNEILDKEIRKSKEFLVQALK